MAHQEEILAAVLALWGTAHLAEGRAVPWARLEERLKVDLTGSGRQPSPVAFVETVEAEGPAPAAWLDALAEQGVRRLGLLPLHAVDAQVRPVRGSGLAVPPQMLHAFAGTGGLCLGAASGPELTLYRTHLWLPPRSTLTARDVLAFVDAQPDPSALREALLWEDENNLRITDGADWDRFVRALGAEHDEPVVEAMHRCMSNVRFEGSVADAWWALARERRNPKCFWHFEFVALGSLPVEIPTEDLSRVRQRLRSALEQVEAFAKEESPRWAGTFRAALDVLDGAEVPDAMGALFEGVGLDDVALHLLAATLMADVFGGMGSWNDQGFAPEIQARYQQVSEALFEQLTPCLVASVNAAT